jgi:starch phosphorylase
VRALHALGLEPTVFHLNEGHSAFLQLERLRRLVENEGVAHEAALQRVRASTVFTTHTPVPAGNEVFDEALVRRYVEPLVERCGFTSWNEFAALGRHGQDTARFGLTPFALRTSAYANGVSELHGEVSRDMWHGLWPERAAAKVPIGSITNGVHARTWLDDRLVELLGTEEDTAAPDFARAYDLHDEILWRVHTRAKERLLDGLRRRLERREPGVGRSSALDPAVLTIGFARRFATYKRAGLLFSDPVRLLRLLSDPERPVQIVFAGKAHPADEGGKDLISRVVAFTRDPAASGRIAFLEDYELGLARLLVRGVDVWLNNPRRPLEASGTSGMKAAMNGAVNCSVLDGWWAEAFSPDVGFAIGGETVATEDDEQDAADALALFEVLERQVVPAFYERDARGLPPAWLELMRNSIARLGARFNTDRMLMEYVDELYLPAHRDLVEALAAA